MTLIQSMEDLAQARQEAADRRTSSQPAFHIRVSLASCGLAAGAGDTLQAINRLIASQNLAGIRVTQIGCIGMCALEPIVQVQAAGHPQVTYGKVTPEVARRILRDHIGNGIIVQEYVVET
jgi:NADP-reducing hydrogenase subunit HndB